MRKVFLDELPRWGYGGDCKRPDAINWRKSIGMHNGTKLGWCNYNPIEIKIKNGINAGKINRKKVEIFKDNTSLGIFESCNELDRKSEILFGLKLNYSSIASVCRGKISHYKGFIFKYVS